MIDTTEAMRVFIPATITFLIGIGLTPFLAHFLYAYKMWKPKAGKVALDGTPAETFNRLHGTSDSGTPRFGGIVVWMSVLVAATLISICGVFFPEVFGPLAFISRNQTWIPLIAFIAGSIVGLFDDLFEVQGKGGLRLRVRMLFVGVIAFLCGWWIYSKLGISSISVPFVEHPVQLGAWFIVFFILVAIGLYAGGVIDGIDGLAGGIFAIIFGAYVGIALFQQQMDIAALCAAVVGGLLAFLWFNIPPARFYLSETGTMGLSLLLTLVAFLTDTEVGGRGVSVLPIIALLLIVTVGSNVLQVFWKKVFKRKLLRIAPLHHHFEALGWPPYKVTMRYWVVGVVVAIVGMALAVI